MKCCYTFTIHNECQVSCLMSSSSREFCRYFVRQSTEHFFVSSALFTDMARFSTVSSINNDNKRQWAEENPHGVIHSDTSSSLTLICGQRFLVNVLQDQAFCYIGLETITSNFSSHISCQIY
jgi:hypothetical protein